MHAQETAVVCLALLCYAPLKNQFSLNLYWKQNNQFIIKTESAEGIPCVFEEKNLSAATEQSRLAIHITVSIPSLRMTPSALKGRKDFPATEELFWTFCHCDDPFPKSNVVLYY